MDYNTLGFLVLHYLPEFAQTLLSSHLYLCCPLLFLPSIFPSIRVFSNESVLHIRQSKYFSKKSLEEFNIIFYRQKKEPMNLKINHLKPLIQKSKKKKKMKKTKDKVLNVCRSNIHIRDPQDKREKLAETLLEEIMAKLPKSEKISEHTDSRS